MKKCRKYLLVILIAAVLGAVIAFLVTGSPVVLLNNAKLKKAVTAIEGEYVSLNDAVPFEWDSVYTFPPYAGKDEIEEIIGFKSRSIKDNRINEGMVHLLFVREQKVTASVLGYAENLGYRIDFVSKVTYDENAQFTVSRENGITVLSRTD